MDCIVRKNTSYRQVEFERRQQITIDNFSTWIASKEDLIVSKLFGRRIPVRMQLGDVKNLVATGCELPYIDHWTLGLGLFSLWQEVRGRTRTHGMKDTAPEIAREVQARLMRFPGSTRFAMGTKMFDSARAMIIASLPKDLTEHDFKRHLYERIYAEALPF